VILLVLAGLIGWLLGKSNKSANSATGQTQSSNNIGGTGVKKLISYTLPEAWTENTCPSAGASVYIIPNGTTLDCSANPSASIKAYVDSQNTTDCQQLKPASQQGIRKHVCISLYIDGHKSLKASTEYAGGSSSYKTDTTVSDYYINTGKGVAAIEYRYTSANDFQAGFDQLAASAKVNT
jgi:hypothetical protein